MTQNKEYLPRATVMPYIPDGADDVLDQLYNSPEKKYSLSMPCKGCGQHLTLKDLHHFEWPLEVKVGEQAQHFAYIGPIPGYECLPCTTTYIRSDAVDAVARCIEENSWMGRKLSLPLPESISLIDL